MTSETDKTVKIGNLTLGNQQSSQIIAPIVATNFADVLKEATAIANSQANLVEWRLDYLTDLTAYADLIQTAAQLHQIVGSRPIIATNRTSNEGGQRQYHEEYITSYQQLIDHHLVDAIDIEFSQSDTTINQLINLAQSGNVATILSHHDFDQTPAKEELIFLMAQMAKCHPSIVKVAVMPNSREDVMTLMDATLAADHQIDQPLITMAMGELGKVTRIAGQTFGSIATFATVGAASAPGQISVNNLKNIFSAL